MWFSTSHSITEAACKEMPINEQYKVIVTDAYDGASEVSLEDSRGKTVVDEMDPYAIAGKHFLGAYEGDYFWADLDAGGFRYLGNQNHFKESLHLLGISDVPNFSSAYSICDTGQCQPCTMAHTVAMNNLETSKQLQ
ncbi:MAG TPA: hypothetical protein VLX61_10185 [Anaerolineales bacterium]|nr:hypothetical protein [Anaerolineales bacterium]